MNSYLKGVFLCLVATISWGAMFPVMHIALSKIDPFSFTFLRYLIAAFAFLALLIYREGFDSLRVSKRNAWLAWFFGSVGFAGFGFLVFLGQQMAGKDGILSASIIMATQPMLGILIAWALKGLVPKKISLLFVALSLAGVVTVITGGNFSSLMNAPIKFQADGLILLGALSWVLYSIGGSYFPDWSPYKYTAITSVLGLITIAAINAVLIMTHIVQIPDSATILSISPSLIYMALIAGFIAVLSWNFGNKILGSSNAVLFIDVVPITAFAVSAIQGFEATHNQIVGAAITALALICNNLYLRFQKKPLGNIRPPIKITPNLES